MMMNIQSVTHVAQPGKVIVDKLPETTLSRVPEKQVAVASIQQADQAPSLPQVLDAVQNINKTMQILAPNLEFSVDPDSKRTIVKVVDQETKEVIRQMPSAEALEIAKALDRVLGLLIRQKV